MIANVALITIWLTVNLDNPGYDLTPSHTLDHTPFVVHRQGKLKQLGVFKDSC